MCGIAGIVNINHSNQPLEQELVSMLAAIKHRGPDESGIYLGEGIGLGNVRLSIIDLSSGQQPMSTPDGRYWIVYNGEVFNYIEVRKELNALGVSFMTQCDTEVVLQAYVHWGPDCLQHFVGQFAIAIWDKVKKELFLARDRMGIRPLFFTRSNGRFIFCSEIKGIFQLPDVKRVIDHEALSQIFTFWTTITPQTPFEDVSEVSPGHYMLLNERETFSKKYWSLVFPTEGYYSGLSLNDATEALRDLFKSSVKMRLRADVEVAAYLSGGIDSSVTTAFIHELEPGILNTFSIGFRDKDFDETSFQVEASKFYNTHHTSFSCTSQEIGAYFYDTIWHTEFPILRTAPTPMFMLSKKVREQNIKVVITGEGADEMLAGYNIFKENKIRRFWARNPQSDIRPLLLKKLYPYLPMMKDAKTTVLKLFFGYKLGETDNPYYSHLLRWHNTSRIQNYFDNDLLSGLNNYDPINELSKNMVDGFGQYDDLAKAQYLESNIFMSGYLLSSQGDRMAMANSVEGRYPFLDHKVVEFANSLPENYKLRILNEKHILKKMMAGKIPDSILKRHKQAYRAPIHQSFIGQNSPEYVKDLLSEAKLRSFGYFGADKVDKLITKIQQNPYVSETENMALAGIISTQLLHHFFITDSVFVADSDKPANLKIIRE
ncbi:MAG: asparagine synthase (glutamine-hydrolyzing) [Lentimicrobium sp.]|jgi:asparagine synthase (glutamine-hydrolysing)|nr:asparagine synthase (glutamine-hydrolyzing) [Lentimicrobium sp.]